MVSWRGILGPLKIFLEEKWVRINYQFISNIFPDHVPDLQIIALSTKEDNFLKHLLDSLKICLLEKYRAYFSVVCDLLLKPWDSNLPVISGVKLEMWEWT